LQAPSFYPEYDYVKALIGHRPLVDHHRVRCARTLMRSQLSPHTALPPLVERG